MTLLLDAGVWLAAADCEDRFHQPSRELLAAGSEPAALDLTVYEVANVAVHRWRDREQADRLCTLIFVACGDRLIRVSPELSSVASEVATAHRITAYDAAYVAAARRHRLTLVSTDIADLVGSGLAIDPAAAM